MLGPFYPTYVHEVYPKVWLLSWSLATTAVRQPPGEAYLHILTQPALQVG